MSSFAVDVCPFEMEKSGFKVWINSDKFKRVIDLGCIFRRRFLQSELMARTIVEILTLEMPALTMICVAVAGALVEDAALS